MEEKYNICNVGQGLSSVELQKYLDWMDSKGYDFICSVPSKESMNVSDPTNNLVFKVKENSK